MIWMQKENASHGESNRHARCWVFVPPSVSCRMVCDIVFVGIESCAPVVLVASDLAL